MQNIGGGGKYIMAPNQIMGGAMAPLPPPIAPPMLHFSFLGCPFRPSGAKTPRSIDVSIMYLRDSKASRVREHRTLSTRRSATMHHLTVVVVGAHKEANIQIDSKITHKR